MTFHRDLNSAELFHVLNRGADRQDIAWRDGDREQFLRSVGHRSGRHGVSVLAYAMMSNHYHLIVEIAEGDLASMMCEFQSEYSRYINRRLDRTGPLFERRYVSVPITTDAQLAVSVRYVHRNPVDIVGVRGLVDYPWSSLGSVVGRSGAPDWLQLDQLARRLELSNHLDFVLRPMPSDRRPFAWLAPQRSTTLAEVISAVNAVTKDPTLQRSVLMLLSAQLRAGEPEAVAAHLCCSLKTVRNGRSLAKSLLVDDPDFADTVGAALAELG